jgi:hypothetical protein
MPISFLIQQLSSGTGTFGPGTFTKLRLIFDGEILNNSDVTNPINYNLTAIGPMTIVPAVTSVGFDDDSHESVVLVLAQPLTYSKTYSLVVSSLVGVDGTPVMASAVNFTAAIVDPPKVIAAFPSDHKRINIVFDRPISTAFTPSAFIRDSNSFAVPTPLTFALNLFPRPSNVVRFELPMAMPSATDFIVDFEGVIDYSLNSSDDLITVIALVNQLKKEYNDHRTQTGIHSVDDTINDVIVADAIDLLSAQTLANDIKSKFNAHRTAVFVHLVNDTNNIVQQPFAADLHTLITLVNELKDDFNNHRTNIGSHVNDDLVNLVTNSKAVGSVPLTFSLRSPVVAFGFPEFIQIQIIHAVFRSSTVVRVYFNCPTDNSLAAWGLIQNSVHVINDGINIVTAPNAFDPASLDVLLLDLKTKFNLHLRFRQFHEQIDTTNLVTANDPDGSFATALTLVNQLAQKYEAHRIQSGIHLADDTVNFLTATNPATNNVEANALANDLKLKFNLHRLQTNIGVSGITINPVNPNDDSFGPFVNYVDITSPIALNPRGTFRIVAHNVRSLDFLSSTSMFDYTGSITFSGFSTTSNLLNQAVYTDKFIKLGFDKAMSDPDGIQIDVVGQDFIPIRSGVVSQFCSLNDLMALVNEIRTRYDVHRISTGVHQNNDTVNAVVSPPASNLGNTITLINEVRTKFNAHNASQAFHANSDTVNVIVSPDATDLVTLQNLANELKKDFNDHRIQPGVHQTNDTSNNVSAPDAFNLPSSIALINNIADKYELHRASAVFHVISDFQNNIVTAFPVTTQANAITLANELKTKFNAHQRPVHRIVDPNFITALPATDLQSGLTLALEIQELFNKHQSDTTYHLISSNNPSVLQTADGIKINLNGMKDQFSYNLFIQNLIDIADNKINLNIPFIGIATRPSLASVIPRLALISDGELTGRADDSIVLGFSKVMGSSPISNNNFTLTGGSMIMTDFEWKGLDTITIYVNNMESVIYNIQAINLFDEAGNQIY